MSNIDDGEILKAEFSGAEDEIERLRNLVDDMMQIVPGLEARLESLVVENIMLRGQLKDAASN